MIHKKGGRIRTYGRPAPDLLGWVAGLAPLVASVPETDALRYPAPNLVSPTPLLVKNYYPYDQTRISFLLLEREAGRLSVKTKRWLFFLGLSNQRMPIPPLMTPGLNFPMWIERRLGMDIDPSAYPECWKYSNVFCIFDFPIIGSNLHWHKDLLTATSTTIETDNEFTKASSSAG
ncbi:unnamed protein product [Withania somnifera]